MSASPLVPPTHEDQAFLLNVSRRALVNPSFTDEKNEWDEAAFEKCSPAIGLHQPCFVTLRQSNGRLRGCVGTLQTFNPLYKNVFFFTRQAADSDPRFRPVESHEVPRLRIEVAVLGPLVPLENIDDLVLGKQGLFVRKGDFRGVLLAKVAVEYGWSAPEFLKQTCQKAGLAPDEKPDEIFYFDEFSFGESGRQA